MPAGTAAAEGEDSTNSLSIAVHQEVDTLNPFTATLLISTSAMRLQYDYLTRYDPENDEVIAGLAESWSPGEDEGGEPDPSVWTYDLRDDVEFSDGEPLTAEDVAWTLNTMKAEEEGANIALANYVANFEEATVLDEYQVQLEFNAPTALGEHMRIPILPEHIWSEIGDLEAFTPEDDEDFPVVGSGPFQLAEFAPGERLVYQVNENYWGDEPGFDEVVFQFYDEQDAEVEALRSGDVDFITNITPAQAEALEGEDTIAVNDGLGRRFSAFTINPGAETQDGEEVGDGHPALQDRALRQAIMHAIDREELVEDVYGGHAQVAGGYLPARFPDFYYEPEEPFEFDPDRAIEILEDAGYEREDEDSVWESPDGDPLEFRMIVHADDPDRVRTGEHMVEWLGDIGIGIEQLNVDSGEVGEILNAGEFDLIFTGWSVNPDPDNVLEIHTCGALPEEAGDSMASDAWFCNEEYDELYEAQGQESDSAARADIIRDMQAILYEEAVVNTLLYPRQIEAYRTDVIEEGSMTAHPADGGIHWGQDDNWAWVSAQPAAAGGDDGGGMGGGTTTALVVVVVLVLGGGAFLFWRRQATSEDRE